MTSRLKCCVLRWVRLHHQFEATNLPRRNRLHFTEPDHEDSDEDEDEMLTQTDYDRTAGVESKDPIYIRFLARLRRGGNDQVLRYIQPRQINGPDIVVWPEPLPVATGSTLKQTSVPVCERCGSQRIFEFQVLCMALRRSIY